MAAVGSEGRSSPPVCTAVDPFLANLHPGLDFLLCSIVWFSTVLLTQDLDPSIEIPSGFARAAPLFPIFISAVLRACCAWGLLQALNPTLGRAASRAPANISTGAFLVSFLSLACSSLC